MNERETQQLKDRVAELERLVKGMQNYNTITPSFKKVIERANMGSSSKTASSERVTVVEAGTNVHTVLGEPDGYDQATINGAVHYYPYYT